MKNSPLINSKQVLGHQVKNPHYILASRVAFWVTVVIVFPIFIYRMTSNGLSVGAFLEFVAYSYIALANFALGYKLFDTPDWLKRIIPEKWIVEWRFLSCANSVEIKTNQSKLVVLVCVVIFIVVLLVDHINT